MGLGMGGGLAVRSLRLGLGLCGCAFCILLVRLRRISAGQLPSLSNGGPSLSHAQCPAAPNLSKPHCSMDNITQNP